MSPTSPVPPVPSAHDEALLNKEEEEGNASDHDDHLNGMDDLLSFGSPGSHGAGGGTPSEDDSYSVVLTPSGALWSSPTVPAPDSPDWRIFNAVHMELQENAKLPTFHWNVNRTGSAPNHHHNHSNHSTTPALRPRLSQHPSTLDSTWTSSAASTAVGSPQQQQQQQPSLMEHFLQKETQSRRHGRHDSYSYSSLNNNNNNSATNIDHRATTTTGARATTATDPMLLAPFLYNVDPTPLEEIKRKHKNMGLYIPQRRDPLPIPTLLKTITSTAAAPTLNATGTSAKQQQQQVILPAAKSAPLQQSVASPSPSSSLLHDAVATAAAIVKVATATVDCDPVTVTTTITNSASSSVTTTTTTTSSPRACFFAARHAVPIRSLQTASTQKSQYGFGRKHVVPSVPAAAPVRTAAAARVQRIAMPSSNATRTTATTKLSGNNPTNSTSGRGLSTSISSGSSTGGNTAINSYNDKGNESTTSQKSRSLSRTGSGGDEDDRESAANCGTDAYERKKQRAKNARVRLNESIDRLAIAMSLAGTQSQERATLLEQWNNSRIASDSVLHHNNPFSTTTATTCVNIIRECVTTAEDAKKWDRPSFVGSAATLIQGMNAQCEALTRELQTLHQELELQRHAGRSDADEDDSHALFSQHKHSLDDLTSDHSGKRRRRLLDGNGGLDQYLYNQETAADRLVFAERTIMDRVASFLEPLSIVRCMRVSKAWKDWGVFSNEPLWQNLAVERFGYFNVRQWHGLLEDHPEPPLLPGDVGRTASIAISSTHLYKKMDAANVMPHFRHEGTFLLGEARLPGKVSAWTFLVERSNGETMRSVLRPTGHLGTGPYVSLPVVQLWTVLQNTGIHDEFVVVREQIQTVDASTRRRGEEFKEIDWDERFRKRILNLDGSQYRSAALEKNAATNSTTAFNRELCRLKLFDAVILESNIQATGCSTSSKFVQRSNYTKVFLQIRNGTTVPLVIPFPRESSHLYAF